MRLRRWEQIDPRATRAFLRVLGLALLACVATDAWGGAWRVHSGELFPWRHLPFVALYSRSVLLVEWALGVGAGLALVSGARGARARAAVVIGLVATIMGLSQRFSNHRALVLIVLAFVALAPLSVGKPGEDGKSSSRAHPNLGLVRAQLVLVYATSALDKIAHGFLSGDALVTLFGTPRSLARPAAWGVVGAELLIPVVLCVSPRVGVAAVIGLHVAMAILLPSVWPFTLVMIAMALLFLGAPTFQARPK